MARLHPIAALAASTILGLAVHSAHAVTINFDDVVGSQQDITNRYVGLGVTFGAIDTGPFTLTGPFPAPATLPAVVAGATTWTDGFASATSPTQVAVSAETAGVAAAGDRGLLISFAFDVGFVSLVGVDNGGCPAAPGTDDCEAVTLTAYDAAGNRIGQTFSTTKLPGAFDQTSASIALPGMRHVAFNYTDSRFGFYAIDDLTFEPSSPPSDVPVAPSLALLSVAVAGLAGLRRRGA